MLAEEGPYATTSRQKLYAAHLNEPPRKLSTLQPDVAADLEDLLANCLEKEARRRPSASHIALKLSAPGVDASTGGAKPSGFFSRLMERRVPHWLAAYLAAGFGVVELVAMVEERAALGPGPFWLSLAAFVLGTPVVFVLAWYHGRAGPQRFERLEFWLVGIIALIWLLVLVVFWVW